MTKDEFYGIAFCIEGMWRAENLFSYETYERIISLLHQGTDLWKKVSEYGLPVNKYPTGSLFNIVVRHYDEFLKTYKTFIFDRNCKFGGRCFYYEDTNGKTQIVDPNEVIAWHRIEKWEG